MPYFAQLGWDCHALNWYGHNGSAPHPDVNLIERGISDVAEEISHVAKQFEQPCILIGHSMGALATQKYAEANSTRALVLLTPVVPMEARGEIINLPVDMNQPWMPPPFEVAYQLWLQGLDESDARVYFERLCPESPKAVHEATRWTVSIDNSKISGPLLIVAGELDSLTPPAVVRTLATYYGADYRFLRGRGHNVLLEPKWEETANMIAEWLARETRIENS